MKLREWIRRGMASARPATGAAAAPGTVAAGRRSSSNGKKLALAAVLACTALASGAASAQWHHHARVGISFGFGYPYSYPYPYPYPGYYYPPYYYPPAVVTVPAPEPPVYVEQGQAGPAPQAQADWYYCADSRAYYPYVKDCPGGWQRVPAQPAR